MCSHDPPSAHFPGGPLEIFFAKAQARQNLLGLSLEAIAAELVKAIVHIIVNGFRVQRLDWMIHFPGLYDATKLYVFRCDAGSEFENGLICNRGVFLRQIAEGNTAFLRDLALVSPFLPKND